METNAQRFVDWGNWGISFYTGERGWAKPGQFIARICFGVGACGPCDGTIGSPERMRYQAMCRAWTQTGTLPDGAHCSIHERWLCEAA